MVIKFKLINAIFLLIRAQKLDTVAKHVCLFGGFKVGGFSVSQYYSLQCALFQ